MITGKQFIERLYTQDYCIEEQREFGAVKKKQK